MPLKTIAYQSNSHSLQVWLKGPLGQGFGKGICQTIYNISLCYYHISSSHNVSNNMILSLYVLSFLVIPWIFGLCNYSTIVTKQCNWNLFHSHYAKIKRNFLSQTASFVASQAATYSASMVESTIQDCLTLLQLMVPPPKVST